MKLHSRGGEEPTAQGLGHLLICACWRKLQAASDRKLPAALGCHVKQHRGLFFVGGDGHRSIVGAGIIGAASVHCHAAVYKLAALWQIHHQGLTSGGDFFIQFIGRSNGDILTRWYCGLVHRDRGVLHYQVAHLQLWDRHSTQRGDLSVFYAEAPQDVVLPLYQA